MPRQNYRVRWSKAAFVGIASALLASPAEAQAAPPPANQDSVVSIYCAAWGTTDRVTRDAMLARAWTMDGVYSGPEPKLVAGRAALSDTMDAFQHRRPGSQFRCSAVQAHHGTMRFTWSMVGSDGREQLAGMDFGEFAPDGRIRRIVGFFGKPPAVSP